MQPNRPPYSFEVFSTLILKSRLLNRESLSAACMDFLAECKRLNREATIDLLSEFLVSTDRLTKWQNEKLRQGRYKGFFIDGYKLLDALNEEGIHSNLLAEHLETKRNVILRITVQNRRISYTVAEH
jgi:eukaryotic-like serine/threonine-protein kinase